jgi:alpha-ketoglutarate-dependent 2,4-dichlorophenoxyacetate dioxygenase
VAAAPADAQTGDLSVSTGLQFTKLHQGFGARASLVDLAAADEPLLQAVRDAMDQYAVLVFPKQHFDHDQQLTFAQRLDGALHSKTSTAAMHKNRFGNEALTDISNVGADGGILAQDDRRRINGLANRLWHTDASFENPAGRYSMLFARKLPPVRADTEFADMRAAFDALDAETQTRIAHYTVRHSIVYSRHVLGFDFTPEESARLPGAVHPLVRSLPNGRQALYLASHAERITELELAEGRLLLNDLMAHATRERFVFSHEWQLGDLVIWDNRCTMHRARPFDDRRFARELTRVTTLDLPRAHASA